MRRYIILYTYVCYMLRETLLTPYSIAMSVLLSTSTLASTTLPFCSDISDSRRGPSSLQGPHQLATHTKNNNHKQSHKVHAIHVLFTENDYRKSLKQLRCQHRDKIENSDHNLPSILFPSRPLQKFALCRTIRLGLSFVQGGGWYYQFQTY